MYNQFFQRYEEALAEFQESESGQVIPIDQSARYLVALDLGSNSFHLIIAQEDQGRLQILDRHKETVRLAEGLTKNKNLTKPELDNIDSLKIKNDRKDKFSKKIRLVND